MSKWVDSLFREVARQDPDIILDVDEIEGIDIPFPKGIINRYMLYSLHARKLRADIFHIHDHANAHLVPMLAKNAPVILTLHDLHALEAPRTDVRSYPFRLLNVPGIMRADRVITVSQYMRGEIAAKLGYPEERIEVVYCGVDHAVYRPREPDRTFLKKYGLSTDSRYVLFVGSEIPRKNFPLVLEVFNRLSADEDLYLLKAGAPGARADRGRSLRAVGKLELEDRVVFCGFVSEEDLSLLYANADMLLAPSLYEGGSGVHVIEAMACGCPVIASSIPQALELTAGTVLHANPMDADDIYAKARALLEDGELRERVRNEGLKRAGEFSWEKAAAAHLEIYRSYSR